MHVFIREVWAGALIILLSTTLTTPSYAQADGSAPPKKHHAKQAAAQTAPLTLKFDGIDLASFQKSDADTIYRDIYSRVRSAAKRADIDATPIEMERATKKIITLLQSDYITKELSKNSKARVTINVDLTFSPLTTEVNFQI